MTLGLPAVFSHPFLPLLALDLNCRDITTTPNLPPPPRWKVEEAGSHEGGVEQEKNLCQKALDVIEFYMPERQGVLRSIWSNILTSKRRKMDAERRSSM